VPVDWVTGACFMIRKTVMDEIGRMDGNYFLFGEEIDWCYRSKEAGYQVCIYPGVQVIHRGGSAVTRRMDRRVFDTHASKLYFAKKFYGERIVIYRLAMVFECLLKIALYSSVLPFSRFESHRQHIIGYWNLFRYLVFEKESTPYVDSGKYGWRSAR